MTNEQPNRHLPLVFCAFFLSGACALSFEVLWTRLVTYVFGGTTLAVTTILTTYMAGLAWGSWWGGKRAASIKRPVLWYAWFELLIGIWGLLVPFLLQPLPGLHRWIAIELSVWGLAFFRFLMAFLLLLFPTWLMGATLPLLSQLLKRSTHQAESSVGWLYSVNTAGAVCGCLATGFWLLPSFGLQSSQWLVASTNIALGLGMAIWVIRAPNATTILPENAEPTHKDATEEPDKEPEEEPDDIELWESWPPTRQTIFGCFLVSGALAMLCQVVWGRVLAVVIGSSSYAFSLVLGIFLFGLAAGASLGSLISSRTHNPKRLLSACFFLTAVSLLVGIAIMDQLPLWFLRLTRLVTLTTPTLFALKACLAGLVILLPTILMGMVFPLVLQATPQTNETLGQKVGNMMAANTAGAILGSFGAGFVFLPLLGSQRTLQFSVYLYGCMALLVLVLARHSNRPVPSMLIATGTCVCLLWNTIGIPAWNTHTLHLGLFRVAQLRQLANKPLPKRSPIVFAEEGMTASVVVEQHGHHLALKVNGKTDASTGSDMPTQLLAGLLPMSLATNPKHALIIGWGSGVTVGAALQFPIPSITAVELEPAVVRGARLFGPWNHNAHDNPRVRIVYQDGRHVLANQPTQFDVIISEPSNPWMAGASRLFTREFFAQAKRRLAPNGMFCQWVQLYELSPRNIRALIHAVVSEFPHVALFRPSFSSTDSLLIASKQPLRKRWRLDRLQRDVWKQNPRTRAEFIRAGLRGAIDLLPRFRAGTQALQAFVKGSPINTDDNALVEWSAPLDLLRHLKTDGRKWLRTHLTTPMHQRLAQFGIPKQIQNNPAFQNELLLAVLRYGDKQQAQQRLQTLLRAPATRHHPATKYTQTVVQHLFHPSPKWQQCTRQQTTKSLLNNPLICWQIIEPNVPSIRVFDQMLQGNKDSTPSRIARGILAYSLGNEQAALKQLAVLSRKPRWLRRFPSLCLLLGQLYKDRNVWPEAVWFIRLYLQNQRHKPLSKKKE
jgi:spermidine synthase